MLLTAKHSSLEKGLPAGPMVYGCAYCAISQRERIAGLEFAGEYSIVRGGNFTLWFLVSAT